MRKRFISCTSNMDIAKYHDVACVWRSDKPMKKFRYYMLSEKSFEDHRDHIYVFYIYIIEPKIE